MASHIYTVYERGDPAGGDAIFVREGFAIFGFVFTWIWLFYHRVWAAGTVVLVLFIFLLAGPALFGLSPITSAGLRLVLSFAIGVFAFDLWRQALEGRGYVFKSVAVAGSRDEAELRYYGRLDDEVVAQNPASVTPPAAMGSPAV